MAEDTLPAECCGTCRYGSKNTDDLTGRTRACVRFPPTVAPVAQGNHVGTIAMWPLVKAAQYCGEWADRAPAQAFLSLSGAAK